MTVATLDISNDAINLHSLINQYQVMVCNFSLGIFMVDTSPLTPYAQLHADTVYVTQSLAHSVSCDTSYLIEIACRALTTEVGLSCLSKAIPLKYIVSHLTKCAL